MFLLGIGIGCFGSCDDDDDCTTPPPEFYLDVRDENDVSILSQYEEQDIRLYHLDEEDREVAINFDKEGVLFVDVAFSTTEANDTIYLAIEEVVDTIVVDVRRDQSVEDCVAFFYNYVGVNGERARSDNTATNIPPVYIVNRE